MNLRLVFYITVFLSPFIAHCQNNNPDVLKKFSYCVICNAPNPKLYPRPATAFFVRVNGNLYLFSASHIFNSADIIKGIPLPIEVQWDTVYLRYLVESIKQYAFPRIPIGYIKYSIHPAKYYDKPDLIAIKIPAEMVKGGNIYSIEQYIDLYDIKKGNPVKVIYYGYPPTGKVTNANTMNATYQESTIVGELGTPYYYKDIGRYDSISIALAHKIEGGFSGSPAFFQYKDGIITFGGVICVTNDKDNYGYMVKPEEVIYLINEIKLNPNEFIYHF